MANEQYVDGVHDEPIDTSAEQGASNNSSDREQFEQASRLIENGFPWLRFPRDIEALFNKHLRKRVRQQVRFTGLSVFILYLFLGGLVWHFLPPEQFVAWMQPWLLFGVGLLAIAMFSRQQDRDRLYEAWAIPTAFITLTGASVLLFLIPNAALQQYAAYGLIYLTLVVYGVAGLSLRGAMAAGWMAVFAVIVIDKAFAIEVDVLLLCQSLVAANFLGGIIAYLLEHRERSNFLNAYLLSLRTQELERVTQRLGRQSQEDPMTGLANRRYFNEVFQHEWDRGRRSGQPLSVIFIDVDHFKKYNDHYGHIEGDQCLTVVARVLGEQVRRAGDLAVRYGGEEFVLLLPDTPLDGALQVANAVLRSIDAVQLPHAASTTAPYVTVSVGVATTKPCVEASVVDLLECADNALYEAKESGRHRVIGRLLEKKHLSLAGLA